MDLYVYSRSAIEAVAPHDVPHVIVSITSAEGDVARLRTNATCRGILRLSFVDAEEPSSLYTEEQLFSREQADAIWAFVLDHRADIERIVVHCDAGVSRSAAVAAALAKALGLDDEAFFGGRYRPSMRVYRAVLEAAERRPHG